MINIRELPHHMMAMCMIDDHWSCYDPMRYTWYEAGVVQQEDDIVFSICDENTEASVRFAGYCSLMDST